MAETMSRRKVLMCIARRKQYVGKKVSWVDYWKEQVGWRFFWMGSDSVIYSVDILIVDKWVANVLDR